VVKQVFSAFPPGATAGPGQFRGQAAMGAHSARWDVAITGGQPPLRPLRPPMLYRAPLPRTKLEATVPDGQITGVLEIQGRTVTVSGWRGTAGHNPEHTLSSSSGAYEYGTSQASPESCPSPCLKAEPVGLLPDDRYQQLTHGKQIYLLRAA